MRLLIIVFSLSVAFTAHAQQWATNGTHTYSTASGNIGIGTTTPGAWFPAKFLEIADNRPALKLNSSGEFGTVLFTNSAVNPETHEGEFHLNHRFNASSPKHSMLVFSSYPGQNALVVKGDGDVGIGRVPEARLSIRTHSSRQGVIIHNCDASGQQSHFGFTTADQPRIGLATESFFNVYNHNKWIFNSGNTMGGETLPIVFSTNGAARMSIAPNGKVGIGTESPDEALTVKGNIHTREIRVDLKGAIAPDYVFSNDYDLRKLSEVEDYIHENRHLPEVPSASEMEERGINLKEMNLLLLKKVEELTLYMIEQNKKADDLNKKLAEQQEVIKVQQEQIEAQHERIAALENDHGK